MGLPLLAVPSDVPFLVAVNVELLRRNPNSTSDCEAYELLAPLMSSAPLSVVRIVACIRALSTIMRNTYALPLDASMQEKSVL
jgi:hypothetical protein